MLQVRVESYDLSNHSLRLGCVVEGPKKSWVRFTVVSVPINELPREFILAIVEEWHRQPEVTQHDEALF